MLSHGAPARVVSLNMIRRLPGPVRTMPNIWRSVRQHTELRAELPYRPRRMALLNPMESSMKRTAIVSAVMAVFLSTAGPAFAQGQGNGDRDDRGHDRQTQPRGQQDRHETKARQPDQRNYQGRAQNEQRRDGRGAGPNHAYYPGQRMQAQYRQRQYVVNDWRPAATTGCRPAPTLSWSRSPPASSSSCCSPTERREHRRRRRGAASH
jgi:Ni/Co efflux regulator RcnB